MSKRKSLIIFILVIILVSLGLIYYLLCDINVDNVTNDVTTENTEAVLEESTSTSSQVETPTTEPITETTTETTLKKETTTKNKTTTKKTKTTTTTKKVISTEEKTETIVVEEKYGSKIIRTDTVKYTTYEDGTITSKVTKKGKNEIDSTNFNGTYTSMRSEAESLYNSNTDKINGVLNHVNEYRSEVGASSLTLDKILSIAATVRALEMGWADKFSHTRPDGSDCFSVLDDAGISSWTKGENIASGQTSADSVSKAWKNSSGHYANMINTNFTKIGIGYAKVNGVTYWVQIFVG